MLQFLCAIKLNLLIKIASLTFESKTILCIEI